LPARRTGRDAGSFGTEWPSFARGLRWPSEPARTWVRGFFERCRGSADTRALVLVGSIVRPVDVVHDADLLYVFHGSPVSFRDHPMDVDVRPYPSSEVPDLFARRNEILIWAVNYGKLVFQHADYWSRLCRSWRANPLLPPPEPSLERAKRAEALFRELRQMGDTDAALEQLISSLTHHSWYALLKAGHLPASRSELPGQLRAIGASLLALDLEAALAAAATGQLPTAA